MTVFVATYADLADVEVLGVFTAFPSAQEACRSRASRERNQPDAERHTQITEHEVDAP